jgi:hypothetical protein
MKTKHYRIIDRKHINIGTDCLTLEGGKDRCPETSVTTNQRCVTSQKSDDLGILYIDIILYRQPYFLHVKLVPVVLSSG